MSVQQKQLSAKYLVIEGNIGSGKSTFLTMLKNYLKVQVVYEPHNKWQNVSGENLLEAFYQDTPRWAYTFQSYAFVSRILEQEAASMQNNFELQVLERSVYSDRYCFAKNCFELGLMSSLEWKLYQEWFNWLVEKYTMPPLGFIYLKTDPDICYKRILKRNRSEESQVNFDYIKKVHDQHELWLIEKKDISLTLKKVPVLVLECNQDFEDNIVVQKQHIKNIIAFCDETFYIPAHNIAINYSDFNSSLNL